MQLFEVVSLFTYGISKLIPKKKNRWIFGAWFGNAVSDNTKAFYDYVCSRNPKIEKIWIATDPSKVSLPGCIVVRRNSLKSLKYILTAKVAVMNQGFGDFSAYNFLGGSFKVQLWHGVAWKKIGKDAFPELKGFHKRVFNTINRYDLYVAPSKEYGKVVKSAFGTCDEHIVYTGQPRNICLFSDAFKLKSRLAIEQAIGVSGKKLVVYMPTFRDKSSDVFSFNKLINNPKFKELAEKHNFVIVEKLHYKSVQRSGITNKYVYGAPDMDAATLLGAADILITDYSSCFFDYMITDKPIIHYVYDFNYYKNKDRGLYYDIKDVAAGSVTYNISQLLSAIKSNIIFDVNMSQRHKIRDKFITFESEHSCKDIYNRIITGINRGI